MPGRPLNRIRRAAGLLAVALFVIMALVLSAAAPAQDRKRSVLPEAQFTAGGTQACLRCHAGDSMQVMGETPHGNAENPHTPYAQQGCESCHGPGSLHVSRARGGAGFPALLAFDRQKNSSEDMDAACTGCHEKDLGETAAMEWTGSMHAERGITCVSCHSAMHSLDNPLAGRDGQIENCARCHGPAIESHRRFETKGIVFDQLSCTDCHDVHQLIGAE